MTPAQTITDDTQTQIAPELQSAGLVAQNHSNLCGRVDIYDIGGSPCHTYGKLGEYMSLTGKFEGDTPLAVEWSGYGAESLKDRMEAAALRAMAQFPGKTLHRIDASKYILR